MKPRRWYSSPEVNPTAGQHRRARLPNSVYWAFTARTSPAQGSPLRAAPADSGAEQGRRDARLARVRAPRLIDAA
jgi:hypothetical protein